MSLEHRFAEQLEALGLSPAPVLVGVSGGRDSLALLHLMSAVGAGRGWALTVGHADHGLHPGSARVAELVTAEAGRLGLPVASGRLDLPTGTGETGARRARYRWFRQVMRERGLGYLFLAHQREDQAETVLMRVLAGSGPAGLAAMAPVAGAVVRPLLGFSRAELAGYLQERGVAWWEDPANADPRHTRSWIRSEVLPLLAARDARVTDRLVGVAAQAADSRAAWDAALDALPGLEPRREGGVVSVAAAPLSGYDSRLARTVLQALGRRTGATIGPRAAARAVALAAGGRSGGWVPLSGGWRAELTFGRLRIVAADRAQAPEPAGLGGEPEGVLDFGRWRLRWRAEPAPSRIPRDGWTSWLVPGWYPVRGWQPGDRIRPLGGSGHRLVVRCLQDARVPRADRAGHPMVMSGTPGTVLWVPGTCRGDLAVPAPGVEAMRVDVEQS